MAGLFTKKKKDDGNNNTNNANTKHQRPAPPPNGLGLNNTNGGYPSNDGGNVGYNDNQGHGNYQQPPPAPPPSQGPLSPMSPTFSQLQQQPLSMNSGIANAPSPVAQQVSQQLTAGATVAPPPPQLFWTQRRILGSNPFPRLQHTSSVTSTGTDIFVFGGSQRGVPRSDLFVIDTASLQCQPISPGGMDPPMPKSGHTAVNIGQYIIYFGGWDSTTGQCDDSLHVLHTARKEWNKPPIQGPLPTPRHSHSGCSVGTTMYIFGGQVDNYYLGDIVAFDMKTITQNPRWEIIEPQTESPPARSGHCAAVYDGKIYIFGGADADYFYNDIWCFDTRALTWTPIPASGYLPTGRHGHSCTLVDGVLYIFGGSSPDGSEMNDAYAFKIQERRWYLFQSVGPVAGPRSGHTMVTVKDKIFVLGGESEQARMEDGTHVYYLEIPKIRFPDATAVVVPPRQISSAKLVPARPGEGSPQLYQQPLADAPSEYDSDRNSGQPQAPSRPDRPERPSRPERPQTQRPASPATFAAGDRQGPTTNSRPLTTMGTPPPRGASTGFQNSGTTQDQQTDGISIATRRQTFKEDMNNNNTNNNGYGVGVPGSPSTSRRTMHQTPNSGPIGGPNALPLRATNASADSPPVSNRSLPGGGEMSPTTARAERRAMNGIMSPVAPGNNAMEDEVNPYAIEGIASPVLNKQTSNSSGSYVPPPPLGSSNNSHPTAGTSLPPSTRQNLPSAPVTPSPSPSVSAPIILPPGTARNPGQATTNRSPSPAVGRAYNRATPTPPPASSATDSSPADHSKIRLLESQAEAAREANERLQQQMSERDEELSRMRKRENWLVTEVVLARQNNGSAQLAHLNDKRLSMADLERELENQQLEGHQLRMTKALIKVKEELRNAKMSIATQAQAASFKIKEAERVRTGALQEAAYLKAKLSSLSNVQQDPGTLARVEMDRAADLEKRLTLALGELEALELQYGKAQESLQQEKLARLAAEERSTGSSVLADQAQAAHTRALSELASLHSRAAKAEAESREYAAQLAESQAGFSGHQSQSSGLLQKIKDLKQQVEEHQTALERTQMAYTAANDRANRAEAHSDESSHKLEKLESLRSELSNELARYKGDSERLQSKVEELESRWQISKDEVVTLRKLVEDGLGAFNPRGKQSAERKHDSIAILSTVSKVSELEHELSSLKMLHKNSQASASKSADELADAMIELSRLEQSSMKARGETIVLQRQLAEEREGNSELRGELSKAEQELESRIKELENNEVQLGLLKDVMREKGIIAEDVMLQAVVRGSGDYAPSMEAKVKGAENRVHELEQELEETRAHFTQQLDAFEVQRQATVQHSEKTSVLLRKLKNDLAATMKDKETLEVEIQQLKVDHARSSEMSSMHSGQEDERIQMLQMHFDEERREITKQVSDLQNRLMESEMHSTELSQKVISLTERIEEVETLNEAISEELESMQSQSQAFKTKALNSELQLKADVERLVNEVHQAQEMTQAKQRELENAYALNEQLETQLDHAQASAGNVNGADSETVAKLDKQRQDLEQRLKKAKEAIQILEGDNSVLEARLQDSEKKVALLLEDMQNSFTDASNPSSPLNSSNPSGAHQQSNHHMARSLGQSSATLNSALALSPSMNSQRLNSAGSNSSARNASPHAVGPSSSSPSGLHVSKKGSSRTSPNHYVNESDGYQYGGNGQANAQHQQQMQYRQGHEDVEDINSSSYRDSVDSITRELEMLKVPWNKNSAGGPGNGNASGSEAGRKSSSPLQHQQQQQRQHQQQQQHQHQQHQQHQQQQHHGNYYGNGNQQTSNRYLYTEDDDDSGDENISYLAHLQQRPPQQQQQQQQQQYQKNNNTNTLDTRSFNDRSPSRLKEYEQMIDEIENARNQH